MQLVVEAVVVVDQVVDIPDQVDVELMVVLVSL
jgi:hypothetical protein